MQRKPLASFLFVPDNGASVPAQLALRPSLATGARLADDLCVNILLSMPLSNFLVSFKSMAKIF